MRLATTASIALLALSSAALAQVATMPSGRPGQSNTMMNNMSGPGNASMPMSNDMSAPADNMMDNSSNPPPDEPK